MASKPLFSAWIRATEEKVVIPPATPATQNARRSSEILWNPKYPAIATPRRFTKKMASG
jgi:hypothetical protein